jgi:hypothetical protein
MLPRVIGQREILIMGPLGSRIFAKAIVADINVFSYIGVDFAIQTSVFIVIFVVLKLRVCEIDFA